MSLNLKSSGGGSVTVDVPSTASNYTATLPAANITVVGTSSAVSAVGQIPFSTDGSTFTPTAKIVSGTSVSASGTSVNFTDIPSWVKRITVMLNGVSLSGTAIIYIRLGSGSVATTGYSCIGTQISTAGSAGAAVVTTAFPFGTGSAAADVYYGKATFSYLGSNIWEGNGSIFQDGSTDRVQFTTGGVTLGGQLDRVSVTTSNGTDTFDAGSINILYE